MEMEGLKAVHRQQTMWLRFKVALLANLSREVRQELAEARSHAAELEVATVQQEVAGLQDLLQEQQHFGDTLDQVFQVKSWQMQMPLYCGALFLSCGDLWRQLMNAQLWVSQSHVVQENSCTALCMPGQLRKANYVKRMSRRWCVLLPMHLTSMRSNKQHQ